MAVLGLAQLWEDIASGHTDWGAYALCNFIDARRRGEPLEGQVVQRPDAPGNTVAAFMAEKGSPWLDVARTLRAGRNDGVMRLACSWRGSLGEEGEWPVERVISAMYDLVWPEILQVEKSDEFTYEEFCSVIRAVWRQYPSGAAEARRKAREALEQATEGNDLRVPVAPAAPEVPPYAYADRAPVSEYALPPWESSHKLPVSSLELKDAYLVNRIVKYVLWKRFLWVRGLLWMSWDGTRWVSVDESVVRDAVRMYFLYLHAHMLAEDTAEMEFLKSVTGLLSQAKIAAVVKLCQGHAGAHARDASALDAHPDLLNTPGGVVNLRTGAVGPHNPELLLTKITRGSYYPGYRHPDWDQALTALPPETRSWFADRVGQSVTGYTPTDGIMLVLQGSGENGKTALTTDGPVIALGDYADMASSKLVASASGRSEHSTEMADLRGQRLLIGEELAEGRSIDVTALKRIQDVGRIKARLVHKDNMTFDATHTLMVTTNYSPVINETDHGTWRRLALLRFPYTFKKPGDPLETENDRPGDPGLKARIRGGREGQHDAIVTWAVEGAVRWYSRGQVDAPPPPRVTEDTLEWRKRTDVILASLTELFELTRDQVEGGPVCVSSTEACEQFNQWLLTTKRGNTQWTIQTFTDRFLGHDESRKYGVSEVRTTRLQNLSRPRGATSGALGKQLRTLTGVRFRITDQDADQAFAGLATRNVNSLGLPSHTSFTSLVASPASTDNRDESVTASTDTERDGPSAGQGEPVVADLDFLPETGENVKERKNGNSPPGAKAPRTRLTDEEKAERAHARKLTLARERAQAREDKIRELGGPLVQLPAVVLRDLTVMEVSAAEARAWLAGMTELSVDTESTGFPVGHPEHRLRLVQLGNEFSAVVLDPSDPEQAEAVREALRAAGVLHAHAAHADLVPLEAAGLCGEEEWLKMADTLLRAKLADPALCGSEEHGLKALAKAMLGEGYALSWRLDELRREIFSAGGWLTDCELDTDPSRSGWAQVPICEAFIRYGASDVMDCAAVSRALG